MGAKEGSGVLFCMPIRTKCILLVSVMSGERWQVQYDNGCTKTHGLPTVQAADPRG
jgi:hypothetical protein